MGVSVAKDQLNTAVASVLSIWDEDEGPVHYLGMNGQNQVKVTREMLQRLSIPPEDHDRDAYMDSDIMDVMITSAVEGSEHVALVGRSCFFYRKIALSAGGKYSHEGVRRETKHQDLFLDKAKLLLIPVCEDEHWFLVGIDLCAQQLIVLDSLGRTHAQALANIRKWLLAELRASGISDWDGFTWETNYAKVNHQDNGYDCGVFVIGYIQALAAGRDPTAISFAANQAPFLRYSILQHLLLCSTADAASVASAASAASAATAASAASAAPAASAASVAAGSRQQCYQQQQ